ncbi:DNA polymerase III subunit gamma/tau [Suttonella sp. R2A3]|uniref:DNA polymerase III subunit gamma/tau n=1 Tax=Suttonella sp. R2A3 TaxID=2908648 RepID=UPI001F15FD9C|nr:DNA polymerase III subunit gamma/tau [Suttonella sp. R2A3]UJF25023.1 DNA polymerase III subunit gamma/tau [Suttonella sp. R2A3]
MYQVLARKWRPKNFHELVGQQHVTQALTYALDHDRIHHAYLFTGTRGVGKTTIARIFAKSLNCLTNGVSAEPCGECTHCREIDGGRFPDLIEVDAASRTGVDDTRELLDNVPYAPVKGRFKVYLIDEVHMFSKSSFNALLKTLEEPPAHVKFILATTDPQKMPATVLSRCLQFHLKNMTQTQISGHLRAILKQDQVVYDEDALAMLAEAGSGSMRDSLSLLDQAIAYGQGAVRSAEVAQLLGAIPQTQLRAIIHGLCDGDAPAVRRILSELDEFAPDYHELLRRLLLELQNITIAQLHAQRYAGEVDREMIGIAERLPVELVQLWYQIATDGWQSLPYQPDSRSAIEMILLRMIALRPILPTMDVGKIKPISEPSAPQKDETTEIIEKMQAEQSADSQQSTEPDHSAQAPEASSVEPAQPVASDAEHPPQDQVPVETVVEQPAAQEEPVAVEQAAEVEQSPVADHTLSPPWEEAAPAGNEYYPQAAAIDAQTPAQPAKQVDANEQSAQAPTADVAQPTPPVKASIDLHDCVGNVRQWGAFLRECQLADELRVIADHSTVAQWQPPELTLSVDSGAWFMISDESLAQMGEQFAVSTQAPCQIAVHECRQEQDTPARRREADAKNEQARAEQAFHDHPVVHRLHNELDAVVTPGSISSLNKNQE